MEVRYSQPAWALGRNGEIKARALNVTLLNDKVLLEPITSKDRIGRSAIAMPVEQAAEVARAIMKVGGVPAEDHDILHSILSVAQIDADDGKLALEALSTIRNRIHAALAVMQANAQAVHNGFAAAAQ